MTLQVSQGRTFASSAHSSQLCRISSAVRGTHRRPRILMCCNGAPGVMGRSEKSVQGAPQTKPGCVFCGIASRTHADSRNILFEDDRVVVFPDRAPAAAGHYQVVPKRHIKNINALDGSRPEDAALAQHMVSTAQQFLQQRHPSAQQRLGFHVPPWNSVNHLHLHAIALPFFRGRSIKYSDYVPWWLPAEQLLQRLERAGPPGLAE